jgi:multidrug efflux pump
MFAKFFIDRPVFAWVIAIAIVMAGALSLRKMPVSQYPQVAQPSIAFNITYPGASAEVVEQTVTALIEQEMNGIEHLLYMESSSELGVGTLTLTFEAGTNVDIASVEAQNRYKRVEARLPDDVRRLGVPVTQLLVVCGADFARPEQRCRGLGQLRRRQRARSNSPCAWRR